VTTLGRAYIEIVADGSGFSTSLREQVEKQLNTELNAAAKDAGAEAGEVGGKEFTTGMSKGIKDGESKVSTEAGKVGDKAGKSLRANLTKQTKDLEDDLDKIGKGFTKLLNPVTSLGKGFANVTRLASLLVVGLGAIVGAASLATPALLSLGAAVVSLSGLALALPAALGALGAAFIGVKFAVSGFSDALKATTSAQFDKATQDMGTNAKALAGVLRDLRPQFVAIKDASQEAFAAQVIGNIRSTVAVVSGPLKAGLAVVGEEFGRLTNQVLAFIRSAQGLTLLHDWISSGVTSIDALSLALRSILPGIARLTAAMKPALDGLIIQAALLGQKFGNWLIAISDSGKAAQWFQTALDVLKALGTVVANVARIFKQLFDESGQSATGLLQTIGLLTGSLTAFFSTASGQKALAAFFDGLRQVSAALSPIIDALATSVGKVIPLLAQAVVALAPGIATFVSALGDALANLGPAITPVFKALSDTLIAIAPVLPDLATAFANMVLAIVPLVPALTPLVVLLAQDFTDAIINLTPAIQTLVGWLSTLAGWLANHKAAFDAVVISVLALIGVYETLKATVKTVQFVGDVAGALSKIDAVSAAVLKLAGLQTAETAFAGISGEIALLSTRIGLLGLAMQTFILETIPELVTSLGVATASFLELDLAMDANPIGLIVLGIAALIAIIAALVVGIIELVKHWDQVVAFFKRLPGYFVDAYNAVKNFVLAIPALFTNAFDAVVDWLKDIPGAVADFFVSIGKSVADFAESIPGAVVSLLSAAWDGIKGFLESLPGLAVQALKDLFDAMLFSIGAGIALVVGVFILLPIKLVSLLIDVTPQVLAWIGDLFVKLGAAIVAGAVFVAKLWWDMFTTMIDLAAQGLQAIADFFAALPGRIWAAIVSLSKTLTDFFTGLWTDTTGIVSAWLDAIADFFIKLPGRIWAAITSLPGTLHGFFVDMWHDTVSLVTAWIDAIVDFFVKLPGRIWNAVVSLSTTLHNFFVGLWNDTKTTVSNFVNDIVGFFRGLPDSIMNALSELGGKLAHPFKEAVNAVLVVLDKLYGGFSTIIHKFPGGDVFPDSLNLRANYGFNAGGVVPGTGTTDIVPAMLTPGEVVLNRAAVARLGGAYAANTLNIKAPQHYGIGGIVGGIADAASDAWQKALGLGKDVLRFLSDPSGWLTDVINNSELGKLSGNFGAALRSIPVGVMNKAVDKAKSIVGDAKAAAKTVGGILGSAFSGVRSLFGGGDGSGAATVGGSLGAWINQAIALTGVPASWAGPLSVLIGRESGGNPRAINLTDSNAAMGDPSRGLMQTIGSTFEAYRLRTLVDDIYDPVANIVAGIRYILSRYGSIFNVQQANANLPPMGYSQGGYIPTAQLAMLHANELVLPLSQPARVMQLARDHGVSQMVGGTATAGSTVINAPITVNAPQVNPENVAFRVSAQIARLATAGV
jgi:phage-related protein